MLRFIMETAVEGSMGPKGRVGLAVWIVIGATAVMILAPLGAANHIGGLIAPRPLASDPIVNGPWSGYGVKSTVAAQLITSMLGSWIQPGISCPPPPGIASVAIGAGLDHFGQRLDGVGTLAVCVLGVPSYFAWMDQAPGVAVILGGFAIKPGDTFYANVTTGGWGLADVTTAGIASGSWTAVLPTTIAKNSAECVVMRGTSLGLLPAVFHPLPTLPGNPAMLANPVLFGSQYTSYPGCTYEDPVTSTFNGFGTVPPPYVGYTFQLANSPPAGTFIAPTPLTSGTIPLDSFTVP
jgi:Peptidase A4 family